MRELRLVASDGELTEKAETPVEARAGGEADYVQLAQRAAEAHLAACYEALYACEEGDETAESPACAPFCGCETCVVRETLHAAWPFCEAAVKAELSP